MKLVFIALAFMSTAALADVLATVGNQQITTEDFSHKMDEIRKQPLVPPTPQQFLEDLVRFDVGVQEAEKLKLQDDPAVKERIRQVLYNTLLERQLGKRIEDIKITENEMRDYYKKNPEIQIAHILLEFKPDASASDRAAVHKRALEVWEDVKKAKRPFDESARMYSEDLATKDTGGDIGYQSRSTLVPALYDFVLGMKAGEVKGPVESPFGYHIVKVIERRSFDAADKHQIHAVLLDEKRTKLFNSYFEKLKKEYKIQVNADALKSLKY